MKTEIPNSIKMISCTICLFLVQNACKEASINEIEVLKTEVMDIHDSIMPYMTKIYKDKEYLEQFKNDSINTDTLLLRGIDKTIRYLKLAEDGMWEWMSNYDKIAENIESQSDSTKMTIYQKEKLSIIQVRDDMIYSMKAADSIRLLIKNN